MYIMCLIIFEEKAEIQDQYPLSLNRDRDRLQKYWANAIYSDSQKHESSCLLSDRFWCISPEPFELQKIFLPLLASLFEELSDRKRIFQIEA